MEAVKSSPSQAVQRAEAAKRTERQAKPDAQAEAVAAKKSQVQALQRSTTNTQGQTIGRLLNVRA